jgi:hypothetical protein
MRVKPLKGFFALRPFRALGKTHASSERSKNMKTSQPQSVSARIIMVATIATLCLFSAALNAQQTTLPDVKTTDGREFKNVSVTKVEPDGITVMTNDGVEKILFPVLPPDIQKKFNYDPQKAAIYAAAAKARTDATEQSKLALQQRAANAVPVQSPSSASGIGSPVAYTTLKRWTLPNGGEGKVIVISPAASNIPNLTRLRIQLKSDTRNDRYASIYIFNDEQAAQAQMKDRLPSLTDTESQFYGQHFIGTYDFVGHDPDVLALKQQALDASPGQSPSGNATAGPINYTIVKRWAVGKVIVIPPTAANISAMTRLGQQLRTDTQNDGNDFIYIFDNEQAAQMRDRLSSLTDSESKFYSQHFIGTYMRNANNGVHDMEMQPAGMDGPATEFDFSTTNSAQPENGGQ